MDLKYQPHSVFLPGKTLAQVEAQAIRSSFVRQQGNRRRMMAELGISKSGLPRKLSALGLRNVTPKSIRRLQERDLERAFLRHRRAIAAELRIHDSTLMRWLNTKAPFTVTE